MAWSEPGPIMIYIGLEVPNNFATEEVRILSKTQMAVVVVSNIRKCFIKP